MQASVFSKSNLELRVQLRGKELNNATKAKADEEKFETVVLKVVPAKTATLV